MATKRKPTGRRRNARQERSKETVQRILDAAVELTAEKGADAVTMSEIAKRADVVIGALYRYFADKRAINRAVLLDHFERVDSMLRERTWSILSAESLVLTMQSVYELYFEMHQRDPLYRSIWSLVQTDAELQALDIEDTLKNAKFLYGIARPLFTKAGDDELMSASVFLLHFAASSSRLAVALPPKLGRHIRPIFQQLIADTFFNLEGGARKIEPDEPVRGRRTS
jgi:AcrR family transcriptional regulator